VNKNQLTPKEARVLYILLGGEAGIRGEAKTAYKLLGRAVACLYGRENDKVIKWPKTIKRKMKNLYMSQFK
jgi:hypothetical protein